MDLILYKNIDSDNTINKTLTSPLTIQINLKRDVDVVSPTIILKSIPEIDFLDYNYAEIPILKRKYLINGINNLNSGLWSIDLVCDVLETYKAEIISSNASYMRNIEIGDYTNADLVANVFSQVTRHESSIEVFGQGSTIILTTVGV